MKAQKDTGCQVKLDQAAKYELAFVGWSWNLGDDLKHLDLKHSFKGWTQFIWFKHE